VIGHRGHGTAGGVDEGRGARAGGGEAAGIVEVAADRLRRGGTVRKAVQAGADRQPASGEVGHDRPADEPGRAGDEDGAGHRAPARAERRSSGRTRSRRARKLPRPNTLSRGR
jgi:hypothetical protein